MLVTCDNRAFVRRRLAALLAAGLIACVGASCSERVVVTGLDADEAQRCAIVLKASDIDVTVDRDDDGQEGARKITVAGDDAEYRSAIRVLESHGLPKRRSAGFSQQSSSLIPSPSEERARFIRGLSEEIEALIEHVDGVASADVLVSVPERRPLATAESETASASVVITFLDAAPPLSDEEVRAIVVQSVGTAIASDRVAVVFKPAVRPESPQPIVRYERDRVIEVGFLSATALLVLLELATIWYFRSRSTNASGSPAKQSEGHHA